MFLGITGSDLCARMAYNGSFIPDLNESETTTFIPNHLNNNENSSSVNPSSGAWFFICFFAIIVFIVIYHWYQLLTEEKEESSAQDIEMGSYYNRITIGTTFALRRNALSKNPRNDVLHM